MFRTMSNQDDLGLRIAVHGPNPAAPANDVGAAKPAVDVAAADLAAITAALADHSLTPEDATAQLIAAAVAAQMPPGADPAVWREIQADVTALLADDPNFLALLRP